jgi:hypothetical protein
MPNRDTHFLLSFFLFDGTKLCNNILWATDNKLKINFMTEKTDIGSQRFWNKNKVGCSTLQFIALFYILVIEFLYFILVKFSLESVIKKCL